LVFSSAHLLAGTGAGVDALARQQQCLQLEAGVQRWAAAWRRRKLRQLQVVQVRLLETVRSELGVGVDSVSLKPFVARASSRGQLRQLQDCLGSPTTNGLNCY